MRVPAGAGSAISPKLTPFIEQFLDAIQGLAVQLFIAENEHRKVQSYYTLKNPKARHYDEAARRISNDPSKFIFEDSFDKLGGDQPGDTNPPSEPSNSNDPHGGD